MDGDLISRDALFKSWDGLADEIKDPDLLIDEMIRRTQDAPAVDAEPVRHGRWLRDGSIGALGNYCSLCDVRLRADADYDYCPHCGAKMDGGAEE